MKREEKYQNNKWFVYYNANPKNKVTCDCSIRAISKGLGQDYIEVYKEMFELSLKTGYMINDPKLEAKYLAQKGFVKMPEPRKYDNTKMTVREWLDSDYSERNCIAIVGSYHIVAIVSGKIHDIWDSSKTTMHTYFIKK